MNAEADRELLARQHVELGRLGREVERTLRARDGIRGLELLAELADHLAEHFSCEERVMESLHYPERHTHRLLHAGCLRQFAAAREELELAGGQGGLGQLELLKVWLQDHMAGQDRRFEEFLAALK